MRGVAADMRAGEVQLLAQEMDQQRARLDKAALALAIDGEGDGDLLDRLGLGCCVRLLCRRK